MEPSPRSIIEAASAALLVEGRVETIDEFFAPDYVARSTERTIRGPGEVRRYVEMHHAAFSDVAIEVEILVESTDRVAWRRTVRGTQTGPFLGFPATDRRIVWTDMVISRFEDGRIAEEWVVTDLGERLLRARKG